jgi:mannitol/fructose-specific phosphotransferase system IIA component (Ntr-type)
MKLGGLFESKSILLDVEETEVRTLFEQMVSALKEAEPFPEMDDQAVVQSLVEREKEGTTGIGGGIAIPHAKLDEVDQTAGAFARTSEGIDFRAVDGQAVDLFFLVLSPEEEAELQLEALQHITNAIKNRPHLTQFLRRADTKKEILEIFEEVDEELVVES